MHLYYTICLLYILWNLNTKLAPRYKIVMKTMYKWRWTWNRKSDKNCSFTYHSYIFVVVYTYEYVSHCIYQELKIKHGWNKKSVTNPSFSLEYSLTFRNCLVGDIALIYFNTTVQFKLWMYEKNKRAFY